MQQLEGLGRNWKASAAHHQHASHSQPHQGSSIMVGKNNEFQIVKAMLIQHSSRQREIVSIQGMGGIGKTTLARRLYEDPSVAYRFDIRAWVVASQYHNKLQMLTDLLKSLGCVGNGTQEYQLAQQQVYQKLMQQRYFVVIDNIWSVEAWDSVKACFSDNGNGSRVLLTTRSADVATIIGSNNDFSHQMQLLEEDESWNLFREKTSKFMGFEFNMIGRQIVEKCKGLPLAIVVAAGLFSKLHTLDEWKNVAEVLNSSASTTTIDEECSRILSSSYNHLPHNLKACFLYLSVFPEDEEIHVKEIVKLWVAEGLVKASEDMSFDVVAKRYIQELKDRNLILSLFLLCYGRPVLIPNNNCIDNLRNLMKLSFCCVSFEGKTINNFSKLPKLEVLRLMECKWIGGEWELLETESFDQLIYLKISVSNLERWEASACHFPNLERLVLDWCEELETIPAEFAEIPNLKSIELYGCLHSAVESAKEIQREQHEQGNDNMVVIEEDTKEICFS
ncbi:disease resistance protein RPP13-like [Ipomoea triloba]|uniref:disease resistance protein RPP13-like n=1 Tax=Ipomoea triloba TaxID=35885 RepID=UPI00125CE575|nr:disease resistance protein RPP13-like [Ipomoea triloba]